MSTVMVVFLECFTDIRDDMNGDQWLYERL